MLSKNFSLDEMTRSSTAKSKRIDNTPNEAQIEFMVELCQSVLQPIRDKFGPVKINGAAADIYFKLGRAEVFNWIKENLRFDQLIWEFGDENESLDGNGPAWIHVSYNYGKNRNQILKAIKQNGKTKYLNF